MSVAAQNSRSDDLPSELLDIAIDLVPRMGQLNDDQKDILGMMVSGHTPVAIARHLGLPDAKAIPHRYNRICKQFTELASLEPEDVTKVLQVAYGFMVSEEEAEEQRKRNQKADAPARIAPEPVATEEAVIPANDAPETDIPVAPIIDTPAMEPPEPEFVVQEPPAPVIEPEAVEKDSLPVTALAEPVPVIEDPSPPEPDQEEHNLRLSRIEKYRSRRGHRHTNPVRARRESAPPPPPAAPVDPDLPVIAAAAEIIRTGSFTRQQRTILDALADGKDRKRIVTLAQSTSGSIDVAFVKLARKCGIPRTGKRGQSELLARAAAQARALGPAPTSDVPPTPPPPAVGAAPKPKREKTRVQAPPPVVEPEPESALEPPDEVFEQVLEEPQSPLMVLPPLNPLTVEIPGLGTWVTNVVVPFANPEGVIDVRILSTADRDYDKRRVRLLEEGFMLESMVGCILTEQSLTQSVFVLRR